MRKQLMATTLILVIILIPLTATPETIDVLIKGVDDGVKTTKQQDYKEAVMNAKLQAIERAGVEISSITKVVNFQLKFDMVESEANAVLLPGFHIIDMGYQTDGTYQVVLSGKVTAGASDDPDQAIRGLTYAKSLYNRGKFDEAEQKFTEVVSEYPDGKVAQESAFMIVNTKLRSENFDDASETYYWLKSNFPQSDFINKAEENMVKSAFTLVDTELKRHHIDEATKTYNWLKSNFPQSDFINQAEEKIAKFMLTDFVHYRSSRWLYKEKSDPLPGYACSNARSQSCILEALDEVRQGHIVPYSVKSKVIAECVDGLYSKIEEQGNKLELYGISVKPKSKEHITQLVQKGVEYETSMHYVRFEGGWSAHYVWQVKTCGYLSIRLRDLVE